MRTRCAIPLLPAALAVIAATSAPALTFSVLKDFSGSDGQGPNAPLVLAGDSLYGTTYLGGSSNWGTIFVLKTNGTGFTTLRHFLGPTHTNGAIPSGNLIRSGSLLYGTTEAGGTFGVGTVFRLNTNGSAFTVLRPFGLAGENSARPRAGLVLVGTNLFGTAYGKATSTGYGTLFRISTNGAAFLAMVDWAFPPLDDGRNPYTSLTLSGTNLFGTTYAGGSSEPGAGVGSGIIFRIATNGASYSIIKKFSGSDGANPRTPLLSAGGMLYGMTLNGGASGVGTLFTLTTNGTGFTVLKDFSGSDGANPLGNLTLLGRYLYGATYAGGSFGKGTVFRINTNGSGFAVIKEFGGLDGENPVGGLVAAGANLYGTTYAGGASDNGVVFSVGLSPLVFISHAAGSVELSWNAAAGLDYQVQSKTNLGQPAWMNLDVPFTATGSPAVFTDSAGTDHERFYRVLLLP